MVSFEWWNLIPWWASALMIIGGIFFYILMIIVTIWGYKNFLKDKAEEEDIILMGCLWPIGFLILIVFIIIKYFVITFRLEKDVEEIKQDIQKIKLKK